MGKPSSQVIRLDDVRRGDVGRVGGKNASLGELIGNLAVSGVRVPPGFATTAEAYWAFVDANGLRTIVEATLADFAAGRMPLSEAGESIRRAFLRGDWPAETAEV
ncbi:MAG TPA: PEP/pyruvate-binding domain-containing protein, partial [Alphaproteobacteria bacterium]|nr:PEP/pyruvate-binding domain-containing protein [Alphaproteobacteria bacterium]